jgi:arylsulfatase A-like enzyme
MRNIVLIVVDTLRADHLGCYGYQRPTSPFLDSLAGKSLVLDSCYSASNYTAPAFTSLFTATYPNQHGVFDFCSQAGSSPIKSCLDANRARAEGIVTFRFFQNLLARIWGKIEAVTDTRSFDYGKDLPRAVSDGAIEWLERHVNNGPFFLFLHYDGPHIPYRLPDDYASAFDTVDPASVDPGILNAFFPQHLERIEDRSSDSEPIKRLTKIIKSINTRGRRVDENTRHWLIDKYDASIRYTDDMISRVYQALHGLGIMDDTVICVLSDHGEEFWDHGHFGHADVHLYDEIIRTVGIVHDPAQPDSWRLDLPVSHIQIVPSLLSLAGATQFSEPLAALDLGETLPRIEDGGRPEPVFCMGNFKSAVRWENLKWIHPLPNPRDSLPKRAKRMLRMLLTGEWKDELYDLAADPGETRNLAGQRRRSRPLAEALERQLSEHSAPLSAGEPVAELDDAEREKIEKELRDLGYM